MFDNTDMPWVHSLSPTVPTIGQMLRKAGYYTAYKGKWHLNKTFDTHEYDKSFTTDMEAWGFSDFTGPGDIIGHTFGGYHFDHLIAGSAITWLRRIGQPLSNEGKPWSLFVSLVNPHDLMYFNTDVPGQKAQDTGKLLKRAAPAPDHEIYRKTWDTPVAPTLREPMDKSGRPKAHGEFLKVWNSVFSRYFAPVDRNRPTNLEALYEANDVELLDLQAHPTETVNLAADRDKNAELIATMSDKLERLIEAEIGKDDGREMPEMAKITWSIDRADL